MMEMFVRSLDPWKLYLRQEDIDAFEKSKKSIVAQVRSGDLSAFYDLYNRFIDRISAQIPATLKLIDSTHDLSKPESISTLQ